MQVKINSETENLLKDNNAFLMMFKIAYFSKKDDSFSIPDLEIGEAFITADVMGMTQSTFRTTKQKLQNWGLASFRATTKGTIAKIITDKFFQV